MAGNPDHGSELLVASDAPSHVARIDAVFCQGLCAFWKLGKQLMAVEMKVPHQWNRAAQLVQALADIWNLARRIRGIHRNPHQLRARPRQLIHLLRGGGSVRRIGVGHGLHHDGRVPAERGAAYPDLAACAAADFASGHEFGYSSVNRATSTLMWGARSTALSL